MTTVVDFKRASGIDLSYLPHGNFSVSAPLCLRGESRSRRMSVIVSAPAPVKLSLALPEGAMHDCRAVSHVPLPSLPTIFKE